MRGIETSDETTVTAAIRGAHSEASLLANGVARALTDAFDEQLDMVSACVAFSCRAVRVETNTFLSGFVSDVRTARATRIDVDGKDSDSVADAGGGALRCVSKVARGRRRRAREHRNGRERRRRGERRWPTDRRQGDGLHCRQDGSFGERRLVRAQNCLWRLTVLPTPLSLENSGWICVRRSDAVCQSFCRLLFSVCDDRAREDWLSRSVR